MPNKLSHFDIKDIKLCHNDNLVSVGKGNICFWTITSAMLKSKLVVLEKFSSLDYLTVAIGPYTPKKKSDVNNTQTLENNNVYKIYVGCSTGKIFELDFNSKTLGCFYDVHKDAIISLDVTEDFCCTGGKTGIVRVWPLDFKNLIMEARPGGTIQSYKINKSTLWLGVQMWEYLV
eukprot:UN01194